MAKMDLTKVQALLQEAFSELMSRIARNGVVLDQFRKEDESGLGLDTGNQIDFSKVLASSHMKAVVVKYADKITELGTLDDKDVSDVMGSFVDMLSSYIAATHADLVSEADFEVAAKEDFARAILQTAKEKQSNVTSTGRKRGDTGASSREEDEMAQERNINANIVNITTNPGSGNAFNFIIDTADKRV